MSLLILKQYFRSKRGCTISIVNHLGDAVQKLESDEARLFYLDDDRVFNSSKPLLTLVEEMEQAGAFVDIYRVIDEVAKMQRCEEG